MAAAEVGLVSPCDYAYLISSVKIALKILAPYLTSTAS
jgi:hypothetical protein